MVNRPYLYLESGPTTQHLQWKHDDIQITHRVMSQLLLKVSCELACTEGAVTYEEQGGERRGRFVSLGDPLQARSCKGGGDGLLCSKPQLVDVNVDDISRHENKMPDPAAND